MMKYEKDLTAFKFPSDKEKLHTAIVNVWDKWHQVCPENDRIHDTDAKIWYMKCDNAKDVELGIALTKAENELKHGYSYLADEFYHWDQIMEFNIIYEKDMTHCTPSPPAMKFL